MPRSIKVEDGKVSVGDNVWFKEDMEQCGTVKAINGKFIDIEYEDSWSEETRFTTKHADRCWVEE